MTTTTVCNCGRQYRTEKGYNRHLQGDRLNGRAPLDRCFNEPVVAYLKSLGAAPVTGIYGNRYRLDTPAGPLEVEPLDTFIACRFDDEKRATSMGLQNNPYSGKWNFHGIDCFEVFQRSLRGLLHRKGEVL